MMSGFSVRRESVKAAMGPFAISHRQWVPALLVLLSLPRFMPADEPREPVKLEHWAFKPVLRPAAPQLQRAHWVGNPIDAFVGAQHEARGLIPRPDATPAVLLRRVTFDVIGLPPRPSELLALLNDRSPDAYERVVDRLLASPHYGERWGRHWMDVWRYSDWAGWTGGKQIRDSQPHIWRWRDWIV